MKKLIVTILLTIFLALGNSVAFGGSTTDSVMTSQMDTNYKVQEQEAAITQEPWYRSTWAEYTMIALLIVALVLAINANRGATSEEEVMKAVDEKIREAIKPIQEQMCSRKADVIGVPKRDDAREQTLPHPQTRETVNKKIEKDNSNASAIKELSHSEPAGKIAEEKKVVLYATTGDSDETLKLVEKDEFSKEIFVVYLDQKDHSTGTYEVIDEEKTKRKFASNSDQQKYCKCQGRGSTIISQKPGKVANIDEKNKSAKITEKAIIKLG